MTPPLSALPPIATPAANAPMAAVPAQPGAVQGCVGAAPAAAARRNERIFTAKAGQSMAVLSSR